MHAQGDNVSPIPGTKRTAYLEENAAAFSINVRANDHAMFFQWKHLQCARATTYYLSMSKSQRNWLRGRDLWLTRSQPLCTLVTAAVEYHSDLK